MELQNAISASSELQAKIRGAGIIWNKTVEAVGPVS